MRICLELGCSHLTNGTRCVEHQKQRERKRNADPKRKAYADSEYRKYRAELKAGIYPCFRGCGRRADTVGHITPLASGGLNVPSNWAPECSKCNYGHVGER